MPTGEAVPIGADIDGATAGPGGEERIERTIQQAAPAGVGLAAQGQPRACDPGGNWCRGPDAWTDIIWGS